MRIAPVGAVVVQEVAERDAAEAARDLVHLDAGGCVVTVAMMYATAYVEILVRTFVMPNVLHVQEAVNMVVMDALVVAIVPEDVLEVAPVADRDALRIVQAARGAPQKAVPIVKELVHHLAQVVEAVEAVRIVAVRDVKAVLLAVAEAVADVADVATHVSVVLVVREIVLQVVLLHVVNVRVHAEVLVLAVAAPVVEVVPMGVQAVRHYVRLVAVLAAVRHATQLVIRHAKDNATQAVPDKHIRRLFKRSK